jgi:hypothetical protein
VPRPPIGMSILKQRPSISRRAQHTMTKCQATL